MSAESVLVAGSRGFLGRSLTEHLNALGMVALEGLRGARIASSRDPIAANALPIDVGVQELAASLKDRNVVAVVNCVVNYGRGANRMADLVEANLTIPIRLLDAAALAGVDTFINCNTSLPCDLNDYARSKRQFSAWLESQPAIERRLDVSLEYIYGESEPRDRLVSRMIDTVLEPSGTLNLSPGLQQRDLVHVRDVCDALVVMLQSTDLAGYTRPQVGSGRVIALQELGNVIGRVAGHRSDGLKFGALGYRQNEVMYSCADLSEMSRFGWMPKVPLADGLARCIASVRKNQRRVA